MSSTSPVPLPTAHLLTALHLTTQTSPLLTSNRRSVPSTNTVPISLSALTKTALSSSGLSTMLIPPVVSSSLCNAPGNCDKNDAEKCCERSA